MAKGVLLGVIGCVTILPSLILVLDKPLQKTRHRAILPKQDKLAGFELEVFYDGESLTKGEGEVTVMKTLSKPHPNHKADGSIWED